MIRRRETLWVSVHMCDLVMPNRRVLRPDHDIDISVPVTYTAPTDHNMSTIGTITEITPWPGYITGTGRIRTAYAGVRDIRQQIIDDPHRHTARAEWVIDFADGQPVMRLRTIHITRHDSHVSAREVDIIQTGQETKPSPYSKSPMATSPAGIAAVARPSPSPRP